MAFPHASFETYTALRDMDISHPDIAGAWRLGQMASWSRWGTTTGDLEPITAHSQEGFDQLQPLTTRVILFAINLGGRESPRAWRTGETFTLWAMAATPNGKHRRARSGRPEGTRSRPST